jgi:trans-aconitate 2-methyltransferase
MTWNPEQYLKFSQPRLRPAIDLLARVDAEPKLAFDLGCGAGNVTRLLAERWPRAVIVGIDDSAEMLTRAAKGLPAVRWVQQSLATWRAEAPADLIYTNAALHWLPDHARLFPHLVSQLAPGGTLAVQMPRNFLAPSHTLIGETVDSGPWRARLQHLLSPPPVGDPHFYHQLLVPLASSLDIWETEYLQVLEGKDPVKEWTKGTWLKQFLDSLASDDERNDFEADYARRLLKAYPPQSDGKTLFPFRRLFIVLRK